MVAEQMNAIEELHAVILHHARAALFLFLLFLLGPLHHFEVGLI